MIRKFFAWFKQFFIGGCECDTWRICKLCFDDIDDTNSQDEICFRCGNELLPEHDAEERRKINQLRLDERNR